ncbi:hypothetical protein [Microbacterium aurum]
MLGLRPYTAKLIVFVVAALCASLAGIAYMLLQSGTQPSAVGADLTDHRARHGGPRWRGVPARGAKSWAVCCTRSSTSV